MTKKQKKRASKFIEQVAVGVIVAIVVAMLKSDTPTQQPPKVEIRVVVRSSGCQ